MPVKKKIALPPVGKTIKTKKEINRPAAPQNPNRTDPPAPILDAALDRHTPVYLEDRLAPGERTLFVTGRDREGSWFTVGYFGETSIYGDGPDREAFQKTVAMNTGVAVYERINWQWRRIDLMLSEEVTVL